MSAVQRKNLEEALAHHTRHVKRDGWEVLSGTSKTVFTVELANNPGVAPNLDSGSESDLAGEILSFASGSNLGSERSITSCAFAGGTCTITLAAALPNVPSAGDRFTIYGTKVGATATENVAQWGGAAVTPADVNGVPTMKLRGRLDVQTLSPAPAVLGANGAYTSDAVVLGVYDKLVGSVYADQAGTLSIQQSYDGTNWDVASDISVSASSGQGFDVAIVAPNQRLVYTNGATAQTVFRLHLGAKLL